ncbi:MAG: transglutaminaseTgpA domain-containing protein [Thermoanaerobaculia bacterium]
MSAIVEIPDGLRRAYALVLAPAAALAPLPLFWTNGAGTAALVAYEAAVLLLWWRARGGRPVRLSNGILNAIGLSYLFWLALEVTVVRPGLLRTVAHLLLFTAIAKLASLKHPGEARSALLVLFLLALAAASSSFHVSSLLYFGGMAWIGLRTLSRLAVLADFDTAPPDRVLSSIPTGGLAAAAMAGALLVGGPLFYVLPRLRAPYAVAPFRLDEAMATTLTADRVDLEAFSSAKKSDRVVLRYELDPERELERVLRLREAVFTQYRDGGWLRGVPSAAAGQPRPAPGVPRAAPAGAGRAAGISVEMNMVARGFLFLPYGSYDLSLDSGVSSPQADGVVSVSGGQRAVRYSASVARVEPEGRGRSAIDPRAVPREVAAYAARLTGDLVDPKAIWERIRRHLETEFVYTLDPPKAPGDPVVHFLLRSRAGHCEYFASAAALMLTSRGIAARLVTGSYGAEAGFLSSALVVRGGNLHAWVEAALSGEGFAVLDPTPPSGIPSNLARRSLWERLTSVGREIEFYYDRRILGFDSLDQAQVLDAARQTLGSAVESILGWKDSLKGFFASWPGAAAAALAAALLLVLGGRIGKHRAPVSAPTRAYLTLRRLASRRLGAVSPCVAPAEVARLFSSAVPQGRGDAFAIVETYCASAFGGRPADPEKERELTTRLRRLKKLA